MKRTFTKYPQGYVKADGMSIASPDEWADNNYSVDELSDEELQAIQRRTANRRAAYEHDRPLWKGRRKASFADPTGSPRIESRGDIAASNKLRKFNKYPRGYVRASDDILSYGKCIGYGVDYRNMHTAIHGILVFSDSDEAEQAYAELKQAEHANDEQEYNDILSYVFDFAVEDIDEINFRDFINVGEDKIYPRYDDEFIIIVNDFTVDLYV